jgi:formamidopyrimidine-DNA glycosylase
MPELPEVETVCRGLTPYLQGQRLESVIAHRPDLRFPLPDFFSERLQGRCITKLTRRAKYIVAHLDDSWVWLTHLGMSGKFVINPQQYGKHDHIVVATAQTTLTFNDPRRFGSMDLCEAKNLQTHPHFLKLGVEPLGQDFSSHYLMAKLKGKAAPIKAALLDQHIIAGIGNIYACESLYRAGIHPARDAESLSDDETEKLVDAIKTVLNEAIAAGGSSLRDYSNPSGELGCFQHQFTVYQREGKPCYLDGTPIQRIIQSGRSTFFCATCQR